MNPTETKAEASFIDFDSVPEPPVTAPVNKQVSVDAASSVQLTASSGHDWANFDSVSQVKAYTAASNSVESVLSGLSITTPATGPAAIGSSLGSNAPPSGAPTASFGPSPQQKASIEDNLLGNSAAPTGGQWTTVNPQQHSLVQGGIGQPVSQQVSTPVVGGPLTGTVCHASVILFP